MKLKYTMDSNFAIVKTIKGVERILEYCRKTGYMSFDFETKAKGGPQSDQDDCTIIGIAFQPGFAYSIPLYHKESNLDPEEIFPLLGKLWEDTSIVKVAWNAKHEYKWVRRYGYDIRGVYLDGMLAKYVLDEEPPNDLKSMVARFIPEFAGYDDEVDKLVKKHKGWEHVPLTPLSEYCCMDADFTLRLSIFFEKLLLRPKNPKFYPLFRNMAMMQSRTFAESELMGVKIDVKYLNRIEQQTRGRIEKNLKKLLAIKVIRRYQEWRITDHIRKLIESTNAEIYAIKTGKKEAKNEASKARMINQREEKISRYIAGELVTKKEVVDEVNFNSPDQMVQLLFTSPKGFRFKIVKYTKDKETKRPTTKPSTDEEVLLELKTKDKTGFIQKLLDHRELSKLHSTYMVSIQERVTPDHKIHGEFKIHGTVTGRPSSANPNLQNIPRTTTSSLIKGMYIPPPGHLLLEVDYGQAELRVAAELSKDPDMIEIFKKGYNVHVATAAKINRKFEKYEEIKGILSDPKHPDHLFWEKQKKRGKVLNFSILYLQSDEMTADQMGVSVEEAIEFKQEWFNQFPLIKKWMSAQERRVRKYGYVEGLFGRRRRLPDIYSDIKGFRNKAIRDSINAPIQGCSSDFTQFSTVIIRDHINRGTIKLTDSLQWRYQAYTVHDSIGYYVQPQFIHKAVPLITEICSNPDTQKYFNFEMQHVKMKVSAEMGKSWGSLEDYSYDKDYSLWLK